MYVMIWENNIKKCGDRKYRKSQLKSFIYKLMPSEESLWLLNIKDQISYYSYTYYFSITKNNHKLAVFN